MEPLVSIIIPVYNAKQHLPRIMRAVDAQTHRNLEVLLVDDGSTDGSGEACDAYVEQDPRVKALHLEHGGLPHARNAGLDAWTGEYLMFIDADDLVDSRYVERLLALLIESGGHVSVCPARDVLDTTWQKYVWDGGVGTVAECTWGSIDYESWDAHRIVWGAVYDRFSVEGLRFNERYRVSADTLFFAEVSKRVERYVQTDERLYCYFIYPKSTCHRSFDRIKFDEALVWERVLALQPESGLGRLSAERMCVNCYRKGLVELESRSVDPKLFDDVVAGLASHRGRDLGWQGLKKRVAMWLLVNHPQAYLKLRGLIKGWGSFGMHRR